MKGSSVQQEEPVLQRLAAPLAGDGPAGQQVARPGAAAMSSPDLALG